MSSMLLMHPGRVSKAIVTNVFAGLMPGAYAKWTNETGRGREQASPEETAAYFRACVEDYRAKLGLSQEAFRAFIHGKDILEYGPGDIPGVALLLVALGARSVVCVDGFPLVNLSDFNRAVLENLAGGVTGDDLARARGGLDKFLATMGREGPIRYKTSRKGVLGEHGSIDLVISRAVLEHVRDLPATFSDMRQVLKEDGMAIHLVDLKSHGMHIGNTLDFLCWPSWLWDMMYCYKGAPNRRRLSYYLRLARQMGFEVAMQEPVGHAPEAEWRALSDRLAGEFRALAYEDCACTGFWLVLKHA